MYMNPIKTMTANEIQIVLMANHAGHLACSIDDKPYVFPMAYVFYEGVLYGQTAVGKKIEIIRKNSQVCFQTEIVDGECWQSVMCWGNFEELDFAQLHTKESEYLTRILTERLTALQTLHGIAIEYEDYGTIKPSTAFGRKSVLYRIVINDYSGVKHQSS
jgi:uncharacterized protein